jgi:iron only hydrogenase large subunit-like protein
MSVFINNLDDFITPSQACINPLVSSKLADSSSSNLTTAKGKITLENDFTSYTFDNEVKPDLIKPKVVNNRKLATVSLNDCLACSGCITSAESILIQEQSYEKVIEKLDQSNMLIVVTLSPQSVASLAASINKSASVTFLLLCSVLKKIGVEYVLDASCGADVSLVEAREEFKRRYL